MKRLLFFFGAWSLAAVGAFAAGASSSSSSASPSPRFHLQDLLPRGLQPDPLIDLNIITEMTPDGAKVTPATPQHPVYYLGQDGGMIEEGDVVAGERPPSHNVLAKTLQRALAVNGYLPADHDHTPTLFIHFRWGSFNEYSQGLSEDGSIDDVQYRNLIERIAIVGGTKFAIDAARAMHTGTLDVFRAKSQKNNELLDAAFENLYFVIASAYDMEAAKTGQRKLLWRTKMSTRSQGLAMNETLPSLMTNASDFFGRNMTEAVQLHPRLHEGKVEVGEPQVKEYLDGSGKP